MKTTFRCCKCKLSQSLDSRGHAKRKGWGVRNGHYICPWCSGVKTRPGFIGHSEQWRDRREERFVREDFGRAAEAR